ncbi:MAG: hypothetical protein Q4E62_02335 [Sutterellaceae bacterium]|nr:hypothetical protein [Sutterellaceae bacterium]
MTELQKTKKSPRLVMEIALVLCCKLAVIFALWFFFFGPDKRIEQTPEAVAAGVLDRPVVQEPAQHYSNH